MYPQLNWTIRRLWRDATTLQLGLDPTQAVAITHLDPALARLLDSLTGQQDEATLLARAAAADVEPQRVRQLLAILDSAGALIDTAEYASAYTGLATLERHRLRAEYAARCVVAAEEAVPDSSATATTSAATAAAAATSATNAGATNASAAPSIGGSAAPMIEAPAHARTDLPAPIAGRLAAEAVRRRRTATVLVHGAGRVGAAVACLLASAGVGRVRTVDDRPVGSTDVSPAGLQADQIGDERAEAVRQRIGAIAPSTSTTPSPTQWPRPDLVVLAPDHEPDRALAATLISANLAHLVVRTQQTRAVVGPFVVPGATACLRCLDLHRTDRDPVWPRLLDQQLAGGAGAEHDAAGEGDVVLTTLAATYAAVHALTFVEGRAPDSMDGTVELRHPSLELRRRSWLPHPLCGCRSEHLADVPPEQVLPPDRPRRPRTTGRADQENPRHDGRRRPAWAQ